MADPIISKFVSSGSGKTYIGEAADYAEHRGMSIQELGIVPLYTKNHGLRTALGGQHILEGWAFRIRDIDGEYKDNQYLLRVCNMVEGLTYSNGDPADNVPKFLQTHREPILHYCGGRGVQQSPVVGLHEKIISAELMWKHLRVPSVAISGCWGWSRNHSMNTEFARMVRGLAPHCRLVVHFDGDISSNVRVYNAAASLRGAISTLRPDVEVVVARLPPNDRGVGWDDWWVGTGATPQQWIDILTQEGVDTPETLPLDWLRDEYGVRTLLVGGRDATPQLEQTLDNYQRLLNFPRWSSLKWDINQDAYNDGQHTDIDLNTDYPCWLERTVCGGYGNKVNFKRVEMAISRFRKARTVDMASEILRTLPCPTGDEIRAAAQQVATTWPQIGRLRGEEWVQTIIRMARDMPRRWQGTGSTDIQWIMSIVGPAGCGKTTAFERLMAEIVALGLKDAAIGQIPKIKQQMSQAEIVRKARDSRILLMDDLNHAVNEADARAAFNLLYTISSGMNNSQRELYVEHSTNVPLRAIFVVTSVHPRYVRTAPNTGERRFITLEVDRMSAPGWAAGWLTLLCASAHGALDSVAGDATEFSRLYVGDYVRESLALESLRGGHLDSGQILSAFDLWKRDKFSGRDPHMDKYCYRFSLPMLKTAMGVHISRGVDNAEFVAVIEQCGAQPLGNVLVNDPKHRDGQVKKDHVWGVESAEMFVDALVGKLG